MAAKCHRGSYAGALASPIIPPSPPGFVGAVTPKRLEAYRKKLALYERTAAAAVEKEVSRKIALLFAHYGIKDTNDIAALASALAFEHVPGLKVLPLKPKLKRGRKRKWDSERYSQLLETVQSVKKQYGFSKDRQALRCMVRNPQLAATWGPGDTSDKRLADRRIETLESRLQEAKAIEKDVNRLSELARQLQEHMLLKKFRK
jgi:hypothetical protein